MNKLLDGFGQHLIILHGLQEKTTVKDYRKIVQEFLVWTKKKEIALIQRKDIENYLEHLFLQGNSNTSRYKKLLAIRNFYRFLTYETFVPVNIVDAIPNPKFRSSLLQRFSKKEILQLFAACNPKTEIGLRDTIILILGVFCGLRLGEIINLNIGDVEDDDRRLNFNIGNSEYRPKCGSFRTVPLWKSPSVFVRTWLLVRSKVVGGRKTPVLVSIRRGGHLSENRLTASGVDRIFKKVAKSAKIKKSCCLHMLRSTHICDLRQIKKYDLLSIAERVGHNSVSTTEKYISSRARISREYPTLAVYWREFNHLWEDKQN